MIEFKAGRQCGKSETMRNFISTQNKNLEPVPFTPGMRVRRVKIDDRVDAEYNCKIGQAITVRRTGEYDNMLTFIGDETCNCYYQSDFAPVVEQAIDAEQVENQIKEDMVNAVIDACGKDVDKWQPSTTPPLYNEPSYIPNQACIVRGSKPMTLYGAKVWQGVTESEHIRKERTEVERKMYGGGK